MFYFPLIFPFTLFFWSFSLVNSSRTLYYSFCEPLSPSFVWLIMYFLRPSLLPIDFIRNWWYFWSTDLSRHLVIYCFVVIKILYNIRKRYYFVYIIRYDIYIGVFITRRWVLKSRNANKNELYCGYLYVFYNLKLV